MTDSSPTEIAVEPDTGSRPGRGRVAAVVVGIVAVLGGVVFAGMSLGDEGNAPEDPVRALLEAVERGDILGALQQVEPGEREAVREPLTRLVDELNRLDVLDDADLGDLAGVEVSIDGLDLEADGVRDGLAAVRIVGGTGSYRIDPSELPLGGFVRELAGDGLEGAPSEGEDALGSDDDDEFVATVRRDGRWYVSFGYSVAEAARRDAGVDIDDLGEGVTPDGADSPEEAVRELVAAAEGLDVRRALELLAPGELSAVHDYAGLFLDDAEEEADEARRELEVDVRELELDSESSGDRATVFIRSTELRADLGADGSLEIEDGCVTVEAPGMPTDTVCPGDEPAGMFGGGGIELFGDLSDVEPPRLSFEGEELPIGIATVRVDGEWYVSPTRTVLDAVVVTLEAFEPGDLEEIRRFVGDVIDVFTRSFATAFDGFGTGVAADLEACLDEARTQREADACFRQSSPLFGPEESDFN